MRIEDDMRKIWTQVNRKLDGYIDNIDTFVTDDGLEQRVKQAISKVIGPRVDGNAGHKEEIKAAKEIHDMIARKMDGAE